MDVWARAILTEAGAVMAASAAVMTVLRSIMVTPSFQRIEDSSIRSSAPLNMPL
jgi:hypothetical protein